MSKVRVAGFSVSVDGFGAGPEQSLQDPLGKRGPEMFQWFFHTRTFRAMQGKDDGSQGVDEDYAARGMANFGAFILGRNMFGPIRGEWPDDAWKGWWGPNPPYHAPDLYPHPLSARVAGSWKAARTFPLHYSEASMKRLDKARAGARLQGCENRRRRQHGAAISAGRPDR